MSFSICHFILQTKTKPHWIQMCLLPFLHEIPVMVYFFRFGRQFFCFLCRLFVSWSRRLDFTLIHFGSIQSLTGPYFLRDLWPWKYHIAPGFPCMKGEMNPLSCSVVIFRKRNWVANTPYKARYGFILELK